MISVKLRSGLGPIAARRTPHAGGGGYRATEHGMAAMKRAVVAVKPLYDRAKTPCTDD